jgi:hypothetical protein
VSDGIRGLRQLMADDEMIPLINSGFKLSAFRVVSINYKNHLNIIGANKNLLETIGKAVEYLNECQKFNNKNK